MVLMVSGSFASVMVVVIALKTLSLSVSSVGGPVKLVLSLLFVSVACFYWVAPGLL